ncbi:MAG: serine/threonine-protein kinase [Aggregatilineales bacterium]
MGNLSSGQRLGEYELGEILGQGGTAVVYRANQVTNHREVALKVLTLDSITANDFTRRLEREFQTVSVLRHPHILTMFDFGQQGNFVYVAMELLPGGSLAGRQFQYRQHSPEQIAELLTQIASALQYAHARGIVHRDLKPQNVLFNAKDEAVLTDFGIAKVLGETTTLTKTGTIMGTPAYMSPEQWRGETIDARTDVYALGAMLFELLTGQTPFMADTLLSMMHLHFYQPPPSIGQLRPDAPSQIDWIVNKALAKNRERRFESAEALMDAFRAALKAEPVWAHTAETIPIETQEGLPPPASEAPTNVHQPAPPRKPNNTTEILISQTQRDEQERRALDALRAETTVRNSRTAIRSINPPPLEVRDQFKGRMKELTDVLRLLSEHARLVSIYGRGGVGKTALACKVLSDWQRMADGSAPDGIVYLSAISTGLNPDRILADFGRLLGGSPQETINELRSDGQMPMAQKVSALLDSLTNGHYILLLDNLETLQNPDNGDLTDPELKAFIEAVLTQGGPLTLLVTSREPLTLPRELKLHERMIPLEEGLQTEDAIALLRASDPDGVAGLRDAPDAKLSRIVERTRGFPRALEAIVGLLLEDSLLDLDGLLADARDGPAPGGERPDPVSLIVQQAINRLSPGALLVMEALAVFGVPAKQAALEFLLAPYIDTSSVRATLNRLVRSYFVHFNRALGTFALHPIDRAYCYEHIPTGTPDDKPVAQAIPRYTRHALNWRAADFYRQARKPQDDWNTIEDVAAQLAEFEHLCEAEDYDSAAELAILLNDDYLFVWGQYARLIAMHRRLEGHIHNRALARRVGFGASQVYISTGDMAQAIVLCEAALISAREDGSRKDEAIALNNLGGAYLNSNQISRALASYEQAIPISRELGDRQREGRQLGNIGTAYYYLVQMERAIEYYEQALVIAREVGDRMAISTHLSNLAEAYTDLGQFERALPISEQALALARDMNETLGQSMILGNIGSTRIQLGQHVQAIESLRMALQLADEINNPYVKSYAGAYLATALLYCGDLAGSRIAAEQARLMDVPENNHNAAVVHGVILARLGEREAARAAFQDAVRFSDAILNEIPDESRGHCMRGLARAGLVLLDAGDMALATQDYMQAKIGSAKGMLKEGLKLLEALMACPNGERLKPLYDILLLE